MKIVHFCLASYYIDNHGYQENILPKIHKQIGYDVNIVASTETWIDNKTLGYVEPRSYFNENGILVTRLSYVSWLPHSIAKKLRLYSGLREILNNLKPDIIFLHDVQFLSIIDIANYMNQNKGAILYVDGHTDYINSARNWISKNILHKIIYRFCAKRIEPHTRKFWGVTPSRVQFYVDVYGINKSKVDLLVMGVDDTEIDFEKKSSIRKERRNLLGIDQDAFTIISGGKIDDNKKIHILMQAIIDLDIDDVELIVFGSVSDKLELEINELSKSKRIKFIGWISPEDVYDYYFASDLAFFPGTHSVLWEQALGIGLPSVFRRWEGMEHLDLSGNCLFLNEGNLREIKDVLIRIFQDEELYSRMLKVATSTGVQNFSYTNIAKRAIQYES